MERRHGPVLVIALALIGGAGGVGAGRVSSQQPGTTWAATAPRSRCCCAWVVPDLTLLLRKRDFDGDLLGTAVLAGVMVLMPLAAPDASWLAAGVGVVAGLVLSAGCSRASV